jgi:hypothetical protein
MRLDRTFSLGKAIRLAIVAVGLLSTQALGPVNADQGRCAPEGLRPVGSCERRLQDCINGGTDPTTCWNAYWRCTG